MLREAARCTAVSLSNRKRTVKSFCDIIPVHRGLATIGRHLGLAAPAARSRYAVYLLLHAALVEAPSSAGRTVQRGSLVVTARIRPEGPWLMRPAGLLKGFARTEDASAQPTGAGIPSFHSPLPGPTRASGRRWAVWSRSFGAQCAGRAANRPTPRCPGRARRSTGASIPRRAGDAPVRPIRHTVRAPRPKQVCRVLARTAVDCRPPRRRCGCGGSRRRRAVPVLLAVQPVEHWRCLTGEPDQVSPAARKPGCPASPRSAVRCRGRVRKALSLR